MRPAQGPGTALRLAGQLARPGGHPRAWGQRGRGADEDRLAIFMDLGRSGTSVSTARAARSSYERVLDLDPGRTLALFEIANILSRVLAQPQELVATASACPRRRVGLARCPRSAKPVHMELASSTRSTLSSAPRRRWSAHRGHRTSTRATSRRWTLERIHTEEGDWEAHRRQGACRQRPAGPKAGDKVAVLLDIALRWAGGRLAA